MPSRGPKGGRKCYITPAFSGIPNKGEQNQKWSQTKGNKIRSGSLTPTFCSTTVVSLHAGICGQTHAPNTRGRTTKAVGWNETAECKTQVSGHEVRRQRGQRTCVWCTGSGVPCILACSAVHDLRIRRVNQDLGHSRRVTSSARGREGEGDRPRAAPGVTNAYISTPGSQMLTSVPPGHNSWSSFGLDLVTCRGTRGCAHTEALRCVLWGSNTLCSLKRPGQGGCRPRTTHTASIKYPGVDATLQNRYAPSVRQGNWFSVGIGLVSKATR